MSRISVILLAVTMDLAWGDPPNRFHPVILMGRWLTWGRSLAPAHYRFWFGMGWTLAGIALFSLPWQVIKMRNKTLKVRAANLSLFTTRFLASTPLRFLISALCLKPVFAYRSLRCAVTEVTTALFRADLPQARRLTGWHLVSRDTSDLSEAEVAGAAIESLAENLTDSVTAPLWAYALGGLPAAWAYRFVNTADAMWGYRTTEFEHLGKFIARLDDVLNWLPARLTGWLLVVAARLSGEDAPCAKHTMLSQHSQVSSPNAGWTMSAMAGALNVTLNKRGAYQLSGGPSTPDAAAIQRALQVADVCVGLILASSIMYQVARNVVLFQKDKRPKTNDELR